MAQISGVGPEAVTIVDEETGARQSEILYRCDLLPPLAMLRIASVLYHGAQKYNAWNWFSIPYHEHLNHGLVHLMAFLAGDRTDDHMGHLACRVVMALEKYLHDDSEGRDLCITPYQRIECESDGYQSFSPLEVGYQCQAVDFSLGD